MNKIQFLPFNQFTQIYTQSKEVEVVKYCVGYVATNIGSDAVKVNGQVLYSAGAGKLGDSRTISAGQGTLYTGKLEIVFLTSVSPQVEITQLYYDEQTMRSWGLV